MLCGQYDILYASLKNLSFKGSQRLDQRQESFKVENEELNQYFISTESLDDLHNGTETIDVKEALHDCVKHHEMILEFARLLQSFFGWFIFSKSIYSGFNGFNI